MATFAIITNRAASVRSTARNFELDKTVPGSDEKFVINCGFVEPRSTQMIKFVASRIFEGKIAPRNASLSPRFKLGIETCVCVKQVSLFNLKRRENILCTCSWNKCFVSSRTP